MKLTMTEGLGLVAALVVGTAFAMAAHAGPAQPVPRGEARRTLERMAKDIVTMPDNPESNESKGRTLLQVARAQLKLGDRDAALATLRLLDGLAEPPPSKPGAKMEPGRYVRFAVLAESAGLRHEMGDIDGARATLERAERYLEIPDAKALRDAAERVYREMDETLRKEPEGLHRLNEEEEAAMVLETSVFLVDQWISLGDRARVRELIGRMAGAFGPPHGPIRGMFAGVFGSYLIKAGDPDGGRNLLEDARRAVLALPQDR